MSGTEPTTWEHIQAVLGYDPITKTVEESEERFHVPRAREHAKRLRDPMTRTWLVAACDEIELLREEREGA